MSAAHYLTCLWPGLPELWWRGRLSAIPSAVAFAAALNLMLVMRFLYPEWLSIGLVHLGCWVGIAVWLFFVVQAIRDLPRLIAPRSLNKEPDRYPAAHQAYLRGEWAEAEGLLTDLLAIDPRDAPALLLLSGVYRHTERLEAATQLIGELKRLEVADPWWLEIAAEERRIERLRESDGEDSAGGDEESRATESADMTAVDDEASRGSETLV